jgi:hypothetical protein
MMASRDWSSFPDMMCVGGVDGEAVRCEGWW